MRKVTAQPPPEWDPREPSARVLMEYLKRVSPEFVATELDRLGLLANADAAAERVLAAIDEHPQGLAAEHFDRQIAAVLEQHGVRLADDVSPMNYSELPAAVHSDPVRASRAHWHRCAASVRRALPAAAMCALIGLLLAMDPRWLPQLSDAPSMPQAVRERVYKQYTVLDNPVTDGARHGVDAAVLRRLGRGMRERGIDATRLDAGTAVALEYEILLEPATGEARFAGLISASVAGQDLQFAAYAAGEGLRAKEGL